MSKQSLAERWPKPLGALGGAAAAVTAAAMALHFLSMALGSRWLHYASKPTPMVGLIIMVAVWTGARCLYPRMIIAGFVLSGIGDIFMMLPGDYFVFGLGSFLIAHIFYIVAFSSGGVPLKPMRLIPFLVLGGAMLAFIWHGVGAELRVPVLCYVSVILSMGWRAAARIGVPGEVTPPQWVGLAGAVSFIISDSLISIGKFHGPVPAAGYLIMATYWLGQLGIAHSVLQPVFKGEGTGKGQ